MHCSWPCRARRAQAGGGGVLTFKTLIVKEDVRDGVVILRNNCAPSLAGLRNGSARSPELQAASIEILKLAIPRGIFPLFLHVSNQELINAMMNRWMRAPVQRLARCRTQHAVLGCASRSFVRRRPRRAALE